MSEQIKKTVLEQRPVLRKIISEHGKENLRTYFAGSENRTIVDPKRKEQLVEEVYLMARELYGEEVAAGARQELQQEYHVSTADHHGPLFHPFFLNGNLMRGLANKERGLKNIFVFSCANVSLNNSSFPRGLLYADRGKFMHLPIFSLKYRHVPVEAAPAYGLPELNGLLDTVRRKKPQLLEIAEKIYADPKVLKLGSYADQVAVTNNSLWKLMPLQQDMELIYLTEESLVARLLIKYHLNADTQIHRLLFDSRWRSEFDAYSQGTFYFWGIKNGKRLKLRLQGDKLISEEYALNLEPDSVRRALVKGEIILSTALALIILSFYYGLKCGGGFSQPDYLSTMKQEYRKIAADFGETIADVQTDFYSSDFGLQMGTEYQLTATEFLLGDRRLLDEKLKENFESVALEDLLDLLMPEFIKIIS